MALPLAGRAPLEQRPHLVLDLVDAALQRGAVTVLLELSPRLEDVPGHLEPVEPERLLGAEAEIGVEGEVAAQVRPAQLAALWLEAVVGAEPVGPDDPIEVVADEAKEAGSEPSKFAGRETKGPQDC